MFPVTIDVRHISVGRPMLAQFAKSLMTVDVHGEWSCSMERATQLPDVHDLRETDDGAGRRAWW